MTDVTRRVRVPARLVASIDTAATTDPNPRTDRLAASLRDTPTRPDGSRTIELSGDLASALREQTEQFAQTAAEDVAWDPNARTDVSAAKAVLRTLDLIAATS